MGRKVQSIDSYKRIFNLVSNMKNSFEKMEIMINSKLKLPNQIISKQKLVVVETVVTEIPENNEFIDYHEKKGKEVTSSTDFVHKNLARKIDPNNVDNVKPLDLDDIFSNL